MRHVAFIALLFGAWLTNCKKEEPSRAAIYRSLPSVQAKNWNASELKRSIKDKIQPMNSNVRDYILAQNKLDGFDEVAETADMPDKEKAELVAELNKLPAPVLQFVDKRLIGIYTVKHLGGSAMAGCVFDESGKFPFGFLILDIEVMNKKANDWASFKENSAFEQNGNALKLQIEVESNNTIAAGIRFILLHELGHIISQVFETTPSWIESEKKNADKSLTERFPQFSWLGTKTSRFDDTFKDRTNVSFYREKPPLKITDANRIYDQLGQTNFPTLYSVMDPDEDFAETFASYVHCILMKRPYIVTGPGFKFENGIARSSLKDKRDSIEDLIQRMKL